MGRKYKSGEGRLKGFEENEARGPGKGAPEQLEMNEDQTAVQTTMRRVDCREPEQCVSTTHKLDCSDFT